MGGSLYGEPYTSYPLVLFFPFSQQRGEPSVGLVLFLHNHLGCFELVIENLDLLFCQDGTDEHTGFGRRFVNNATTVTEFKVKGVVVTVRV